MGTGWLIGMTIILGIIPIILKKKDNNDGNVEGEVRYPKVFGQILYSCFIISLVFAVFIIYTIQDIAIAALFIIAGIVCIFITIAINRFKITVNGIFLIIVPPVGRKNIIKILDIDCLEEDQEGGIKIIVKGKKVAVVNPMSVGIHELVKVLEKRKVHISYSGKIYK